MESTLWDACFVGFVADYGLTGLEGAVRHWSTYNMSVQVGARNLAWARRR
jgi:hypothetical protein